VRAQHTSSNNETMPVTQLTPSSLDARRGDVIRLGGGPTKPLPEKAAQLLVTLLVNSAQCCLKEGEAKQVTTIIASPPHPGDVWHWQQWRWLSEARLRQSVPQLCPWP
jgi:hypothetical protein